MRTLKETKVADFVFKAILYPWIALVGILYALVFLNTGELPITLMSILAVAGLAVAYVAKVSIGLLESWLS
jgi:hypothetical protein